MKKIAIILFAVAFFATTVNAQKTVMVSISHEEKEVYLRSSPQMFEQYREIIEDALNARFVLNENQEISSALLAEIDLLIMPSPLSRNSSRPLTATERRAIVDYVKNGGRLIFFTDEELRVDVDEFGGNDIVRPFGMNFGGDVPRLASSAISFIGEVFSDRYIVPYVGSRELTGGIPISVKNSEGGHVHGAYVKHESGGIIVAFGETMVGLFLGGVGRWEGTVEDNRQFMLELIEWALRAD